MCIQSYSVLIVICCSPIHAAQVLDICFVTKHVSVNITCNQELYEPKLVG